MASTEVQSDLEKIRAKYKLKPVQSKQEKVRAEWERKPVTKPVKKAAKEYYVISYEDLVFWVANANRTIFSDALTQYNKLKKRGVTLEIRWYWDKIDIHVL